jgi:hypothetical protein
MEPRTSSEIQGSRLAGLIAADREPRPEDRAHDATGLEPRTTGRVQDDGLPGGETMGLEPSTASEIQGDGLAGHRATGREPRTTRRVQEDGPVGHGAAGREPRDVATTQEPGSICCFQIWNKNGGPGSWSPQAERWLRIVLLVASANDSSFSDSSSSSGASMDRRQINHIPSTVGGHAGISIPNQDGMGTIVGERLATTSLDPPTGSALAAGQACADANRHRGGAVYRGD